MGYNIISITPYKDIDELFTSFASAIQKAFGTNLIIEAQEWQSGQTLH